MMYPEDSDKTSVILKKMLLSSLSSNLRMTDKQKQDLAGRRWGYKINETSHEGRSSLALLLLNTNFLVSPVVVIEWAIIIVHNHSCFF